MAASWGMLHFHQMLQIGHDSNLTVSCIFECGFSIVSPFDCVQYVLTLSLSCGLIYMCQYWTNYKP